MRVACDIRSSTAPAATYHRRRRRARLPRPPRTVKKRVGDEAARVQHLARRGRAQWVALGHRPRVAVHVALQLGVGPALDVPPVVLVKVGQLVVHVHGRDHVSVHGERNGAARGRGARVRVRCASAVVLHAMLNDLRAGVAGRAASGHRPSPANAPNARRGARASDRHAPVDAVPGARNPRTRSLAHFSQKPMATNGTPTSRNVMTTHRGVRIGCHACTGRRARAAPMRARATA